MIRIYIVLTYAYDSCMVLVCNSQHRIDQGGRAELLVLVAS